METKNKWYHTTFGIIVLLALFFPIGLYLMWRYTNWDMKLKWGITGFFGIMMLINSIMINSRPAPVRVTNLPTEQPWSIMTPPPAEAKKLSYEVVKKEVNSTVENYKILVAPGEDAKSVALEVKKTCRKPCNVSVFDDRKALDLQVEYDTMMGNLDTPVSVPQDWKKKNYVFVGDHLVGDIMFDTEDWAEYPYKDWYYKELKGE